MPTKKAAATNGVMDIGDVIGMLPDLTGLGTYECTIPREGETPLTVTLRKLSVRDSNAVPYGDKVPLTDAFAVIYRHVLQWDLRLVNSQTGQEIAVPPPAAGDGETGPQLLELLDSATAAMIVLWLKAPHVMRTLDQKKASSASEPAPAPLPDAT